jgi:uncharacterized OsmC-like protein
MTVKFSGYLVGSTQTNLTHLDSGTTIKTTAPVDNGGDGSSFSPTDLFASSLGSCATTIMGMYAAKNNIPLAGIEFEMEKHMSTTAPRRVAKIVAKFYLETDAGEEDFKRLTNAGRTCPVQMSLKGSDVEVEDTYHRRPAPTKP